MLGGGGEGGVTEEGGSGGWVGGVAGEMEDAVYITVTPASSVIEMLFQRSGGSRRDEASTDGI